MFEYTKPSVEIITFMSRETLATMDDPDNNVLPLPDQDLSFGETVEPWE